MSETVCSPIAMQSTKNEGFALPVTLHTRLHQFCALASAMHQHDRSDKAFRKRNTTMCTCDCHSLQLEKCLDAPAIENCTYLPSDRMYH
eukprot:1522-Heterococcus_DN1.PRE.6